MSIHRFNVDRYLVYVSNKIATSDISNDSQLQSFQASQTTMGSSKWKTVKGPVGVVLQEPTELRETLVFQVLDHDVKLEQIQINLNKQSDVSIWVKGDGQIFVKYATWNGTIRRFQLHITSKSVLDPMILVLSRFIPLKFLSSTTPANSNLSVAAPAVTTVSTVISTPLLVSTVTNVAFPSVSTPSYVAASAESNVVTSLPLQPLMLPTCSVITTLKHAPEKQQLNSSEILHTNNLRLGNTVSLSSTETQTNLTKIDQSCVLDFDTLTDEEIQIFYESISAMPWFQNLQKIFEDKNKWDDVLQNALK